MFKHKKCHSVDVLHEDVGADKLEIDLSDRDRDQDVDWPKSVDDAMPFFDNIFDIFRSPFIEE